jgi:hypothetical protein
VDSLVILGDDHINWRPNAYRSERWGCWLSLRFPIVKLLDYETRWAALESSQNLFASMVMAHLQTQATTQDSERRQQWKVSLIKRLYDQGYSQDSIFRLSYLLDVMMTLLEDLELAVKTEIQRFARGRLSGRS